MSFFKQKPSTSTDIAIGLNDKFHTENSDELDIEDDVLSSSSSATHDLPKIEGFNGEFHYKNSDIMLEAENDLLSSSNGAIHDLPKIEGLNDEFHTKNSDVLEIEDDVLSSSNNVTHDLPKIEVFKNDPASIPLVISDEVLHYYMSLGPCQPKAHDLLNNTFPKTYEKSGHIRSFNECYYYKKKQ